MENIAEISSYDSWIAYNSNPGQLISENKNVENSNKSQSSDPPADGRGQIVDLNGW